MSLIRSSKLTAIVVSLAATCPCASVADETADYRARAKACAEVLQQWYDVEKGVWKTTSWWNAANALTTLVHYTRLTDDDGFRPVIANTFDRCREFVVDDDPENVWVCRNFINAWHDDAGWWVIVWIDAYDLTGETRYLDMAKTTFADMTTGWDKHCDGGVYWKKPDIGKHTITNGLFMIGALRLDQRSPGAVGGRTYREWGTAAWDWLKKKGLVNQRQLVENGLSEECERTEPIYYTYNQGVVIGGLIELAKSTGDKTYLDQAEKIADASIEALVDDDGVLRDPKEPEVTGDSAQFKGVYMRHLLTLYQTTGKASYRQFIEHNADRLWQQARDKDTGHIGALWNGPFDQGDAARQSSALDALNAAIGAQAMKSD